MKVKKEYIIMCEKAEELQKAWQPEIGDYFYPKRYEDGETTLFMIANMETLQEVEKNKRKYIWLPRQDQLQEMLKDAIERVAPLNAKKELTHIDLVKHFSNFISLMEFADKNDSIEMMWLKYFMFQKFKKLWLSNEKRWEKIGEVLRRIDKMLKDIEMKGEER